MEKKRIYLSSPTMNGSEINYIREAFESNWIAPLGPNVDGFERELAAFLGIRHGLAVSSGTAAIHLALRYAGVGEGDIVFCSSLTFIASCNPIRYLGAKPVFIDSEYESWNMDPVALRRAFAEYPQVKAVIIVNLYGTPARLIEIAEICREYGVPLIEDAAESLGSKYYGKYTGTFGSFGVFSFNGNKIITSAGGGMVVSEDEEAIEKLRFWATQAREKERHYEHKEIGYNYRMSNILAGIGRGQLLSLPEYVKRKKLLYETYKKAFADIPQIKMNPVPEHSEPNYWLSCITLEGEELQPLDIMEALERENIEARPLWKPMHLQPVYRECDFIHTQDAPDGAAGDLYRRGLCLPSDIKNTQEDMEAIIAIIRNLFGR